MIPRLLFCAFLVGALAAPGVAQTVAARDPQAVALVGQALSALTGGTQVNNVILQASATFIAGSDQEMGPATLEAKGNGESRIVLNLTGGTRQEVRNGPAGAWIGADGVAHAMALHNCWTDASWFFPLLSLAAALNDPTIGMAYLGQETLNGEAVQRLQLWRVLPSQSGTAAALALIQQLSTVDLYLDAASYLPVALGFNGHPDNDPGLKIPVGIQFSNYQNVNGVQIPYRIQKCLQGTLTLDVIVANALTNSDIPDSEFTIPALATGGAQ